MNNTNGSTERNQIMESERERLVKGIQGWGIKQVQNPIRAIMESSNALAVHLTLSILDRCQNCLIRKVAEEIKGFARDSDGLYLDLSNRRTAEAIADRILENVPGISKVAA